MKVIYRNGCMNVKHVHLLIPREEEGIQNSSFRSEY